MPNAARTNPVTLETLASVQVYGVAEMLKALQQIDPQLRKATISRMKLAAKPMIDEARSLVPEASPLDNWGNWTTPKGHVIGPYDPRKARQGIKVTYKGPSKRTKYLSQFPLLKLVNDSAAGSIVDIAGRAGGHGKKSEGGKRGQAMIGKINRELGRNASRIAWLAAERQMPIVQAEVNAAIEDMEFAIQKRVDMIRNP